MKSHSHQTRLFASLASAILSWTLTTAHAQTYTWDPQADGSVYLSCPDIAPAHWPSNSLWSQSLQMSPNCDNTAQVISAPSNWTPAPPVGVYPGGPNAVGVDVVLGAPANTLFDATVTLNSLTIKTNGGITGQFGNNGGVTANTFDFQGDGSMSNIAGITIAPGGTLVKSGGTGTFDFGSGSAATGLKGTAATIVVKSGTLAFPAGNNDTRLDGGGTFAVSNNATLIVAPDSATGTAMDGTFTGVGGGTVLLNAGILNFGPSSGSSSLNFLGSMFQWTGGQFAGTVTNNGTINISNAPAMSAFLYNNGMVKLADGSAFYVNNAFFNNQSGTIDLQGDAGMSGAAPIFNRGVFKKSAGTGISRIFPQFQNLGGTVEVDSGTLAVGLSQNDTISNATFVVQSGATFDLSISNNNTAIAGVLTGSGGGTVFMNSGAVLANQGATLSFPGAMFQLAGGQLGGGNATLTNIGTINLTGPAGLHSLFVNNGTLIESGAGDNNDNSGQLFNYGVYEIQNNGGAQLNYFYNYGLLEKEAGSGTSVISATFNNSGTIQATTGTLLFTGGTFNQNAGTLQITPAIAFTNSNFYLKGGTVTGVGTVGDNYMEVDAGVLAPGNPFGTLNVSGGFSMPGGGTGSFNVALGGPSQFSQLTVSGNASVNSGSTLNVTLTNGYVPAIGTQFHILSSANFGGGFAKLNLPAGIAVTYSNASGVYLTVIGSTPAQLQSPQVSGGNFTYSFGTTNGLGYTVQQNSDLSTTNWNYYTNLIGNGSLYQVISPITNKPQIFFRVRQP